MTPPRQLDPRATEDPRMAALLTDLLLLDVILSQPPSGKPAVPCPPDIGLIDDPVADLG